VTEALRAQLAERVRAAEQGSELEVIVDIPQPTARVERLILAVAHIHGTGVKLVELNRVAQRVSIDVDASQGARGEMSSCPKAASPAALDRAGLAFSARLQVRAPQADTLTLRPMNVVHDTQLLAARLWTADGKGRERLFVGQPSNLTEHERAPLVLIEQILEDLPCVAEPAESVRSRELLRDGWPAQGAWPAWAVDRLPSAP